MLILALDTATPAVAVAVCDDGAVLAESSQLDGRRRHGELLAPAIASCLARAGLRADQLDMVAVGVGPGPFTGLRVGVVTALALAAALDRPVHGVCSLDALAAATTSDRPFAVATDARRREVYWARYTDPLTRAEGPDVGRPAAVAARLDVPVAGAGARLYAEHFPCRLDGPDHPSAAALGRLAWQRLVRGDPPLAPEPLYLRSPDAAVPGRPKEVLPR